MYYQIKILMIILSLKTIFRQKNFTNQKTILIFPIKWRSLRRDINTKKISLKSIRNSISVNCAIKFLVKLLFVRNIIVKLTPNNRIDVKYAN